MKPFVSGMYGISATELTGISLFLIQSGKPPISDMFTDLKDGRKLLDLLEGLTGTSLVRECLRTSLMECLSLIVIDTWRLTVCTYNVKAEIGILKKSFLMNSLIEQYLGFLEGSIFIKDKNYLKSLLLSDSPAENFKEWICEEDIMFWVIDSVETNTVNCYLTNIKTRLLKTMTFIFIQVFSIIFAFVSSSNPTLLLHVRDIVLSHRSNSANEGDAFCGCKLEHQR